MTERMNKLMIAAVAAVGLSLSTPTAWADGYDGSLDLEGANATYLESPTGDFLSYPGYLTTMDTTYLQPLGDTGPVTPLNLPTDSFDYGTSVPQGTQDVVNTVLKDYNAGDLSPAHPDVIMGYSDSTVMDSAAEPILYADGVPTGDVDFVFVGDTSQASTGYIADFVDNPSNAWIIDLLGLQDLENIITPDNFYNTDVVYLQGDGYADYAANDWLGSTLHELYGGVAESQLQNAVETTTGLTNTFEIPMPDADIGALIDATLQNIFGW